jgi:hypothetical protein
MRQAASIERWNSHMPLVCCCMGTFRYLSAEAGLRLDGRITLHVPCAPFQPRSGDTLHPLGCSRAFFLISRQRQGAPGECRAFEPDFYRNSIGANEGWL